MQSPVRDLGPLTLARHSGLPLYLQIAHDFMYRLEMGMIRTGDPLPSVRQLAQQLKVSLLTVDKAYKWLQSRGVVASQPGVGWKVTLSSADSSGEEIRQRVRIVRFVDQMLEQAVRQGFDPITIAQSVLQRAMVMERRIPARKLVFVECHPEYVDDYIEELRRELDDLNIEIHGLLTTTLPACVKGKIPEAKVLSEADYVMSTLYHFEFVQRTVAPLKQRVVALSHTIDKDAVYKIVSLPRDVRFGVILGPHDPAPAIVRTLEFYRDLPPGFIPYAVISDTRAVRRLKAKADVIAYTAACKEQIGSLVGDDGNAILVRFVPDDEAIRKIRTLLGIPRSGESLSK